MIISADRSVPTAREVDLSMFGIDPWWLVIVKAVLIFAFLVLTTLVLILAERKVMAWMQMRVGPNRVGPKGLLQTVADGIKLGLKEGIIPSGVDKPLYLLAPVLATAPASWPSRSFRSVPWCPCSETHAAAVDRPARRRALHPRRHLDRCVRDRARRVGVGIDISATGRIALDGAGHFVRDRDGTVFRRRLPLAGTMSTSGIVAEQTGIWYVFSFCRHS